MKLYLYPATYVHIGILMAHESWDVGTEKSGGLNRRKYKARFVVTFCLLNCYSFKTFAVQF